MQGLCLSVVNIIPERVPILSTLSFRRLQKLVVEKYCYGSKFPHRTWPLELLEQVKKSLGLRDLLWEVADIPFPIDMFQKMLAEENCWPALYKLTISDSKIPDRDLANILKRLPSRRLTSLYRSSRGTVGALTYSCLKEMYFDHLRELLLHACIGFTSGMVQELLTECVHLVNFEAPYIYVLDIASSPKPWGCLNLEELKIYIAKQPDDEAGWEGQVFEQISRLRRLLILSLKRNRRICDDNEVDDDRVVPFSLETLDLRFGCSSRPNESSNSGADISCWSSLVQLWQFRFDGDRQVLGMEEALWMTENWRDLKYVVGCFKGVELRDNLELFFAKRGVVMTM